MADTIRININEPRKEQTMTILKKQITKEQLSENKKMSEWLEKEGLFNHVFLSLLTDQITEAVNEERLLTCDEFAGDIQRRKDSIVKHD